jgi:predicted RNA-binding Zn ribbon-like protein
MWVTCRMTGMIVEFQLIAGHIALDFANTLDYRFDSARTIELIPSYERLVDFARQSRLITEPMSRRFKGLGNQRVSESVLKRAIQFRETVDPLFRSVIAKEPPKRNCLEKFNQFVRECRAHERFYWKSGEMVRGYGDVEHGPEDLLWLLIEPAASLLTSADFDHVRECHETSCRWLFLDHSKNHSRRWCSMKLCGNRSKIRRFRGQE